MRTEPAPRNAALPVPRVRDARGLTHELRRYLSGQYRELACRAYEQGCPCERCKFATDGMDVVLNRIPISWEDEIAGTTPFNPPKLTLVPAP